MGAELSFGGRPVQGFLGTIGTLHTTHEASDLLRALSFEVSRFAEAVAVGGDKWKDADLPGYLAWLTDYGNFSVAWADQQEVAQNALDIIPKVAWDITPAEAVFQGILTAFHPIHELDRRWNDAAAKIAGMPYPDYSGIPQPTAPDFDLKAYQVTNAATKKLESLGGKLESAAPAIFGTLVVVAGLWAAAEAFGWLKWREKRAT